MEEATAPVINLVFHGAVFTLALVTFIAAVLGWYVRHKRGEQVGEYWKMFVFGLFFYTVSEFSDLFTPGLRASLGMHNYFTELALLIALAFIFIAMRRIVLPTDAKG